MMKSTSNSNFNPEAILKLHKLQKEELRIEAEHTGLCWNCKQPKRLQCAYCSYCGRFGLSKPAPDNS